MTAFGLLYARLKRTQTKVFVWRSVRQKKLRVTEKPFRITVPIFPQIGRKNSRPLRTFREFSRLKFASLDTINVFVPLKFTNFSIAKIRNFTVYVRNIFVSTTRYLCEDTTCFYVQARTQTQCRNYSGTCQNRFLHISLPLG